MILDDLTDVMDRLVGSDPASCADPEAVELLVRQLDRLEAFTTATAAAFDASGRWAPDGARTAGAWLATRCRMPRARARRLVTRGREVRHLPATGQAWLDGALSAAHVDVLAALRRPATEEALARDEALLVDQAGRLRFASFTRATAYWEQLADPEGTEAGDEERRSRRDAYLAASFGGMWLGKVTLDPISGAIVSGELERLEGDLFASDWAGAREELGREPTVAELARTPGQRRADALVEMATRSRVAPADGKRPAPLFTVLVDWPSVTGRLCELADGTVVAPGALVPWLDRALLERAVFGPDRRVEVGVTTRLYTGATRRAIELRDRECTHPYCDRSPSECEIDHIVPYSAGGPTTQANGRLLCGFHNRLRNQRPPPPDDQVPLPGE